LRLRNRLKDNKWLMVKDGEAGREAEAETYVGQVEARDDNPGSGGEGCDGFFFGFSVEAFLNLRTG